MKTIYADNAATTYPRPPQVIRAMSSYLRDIGCNPGRGGYKGALDAARMVYEARSALASFFNVPSPEQVVFTPSITYSLNLVIKGLLSDGDHVLLSSMEHNAVVRPLTRLAEKNSLQIEILPCSPEGILDPLQVKEALRPNTKLVLLTHASNVTGTIMPVYEVGEILKHTGVFYCIDTAQTAGSEILDFQDLHCDYLAFTGHKGLLGPPGIGGLCISERAAEITKPLVEGGTGSRSEDVHQPGFLPDKFESGTQNAPGIAGLLAGVKLITEKGLDRIKKHKTKLTDCLLNGLKTMPEATVYGTQKAESTAAVVSLNLSGMDNGELSFILEQKYGIMTRSGLHCAPLAHKTIGTFPQGTIRISFGFQSKLWEVEKIVSALRDIVKTASKSS